MKPIAKVSAQHLAADELRSAIRQGKWQRVLPGIRTLAASLQVSGPTIVTALHLLVKEGIVKRGGMRKPYQIIHKSSRCARGVQSSRKKILILSHVELIFLPELARRMIEKLRTTMTAKGWNVEFQVFDFIHVKRAKRSWNEKVVIEEGQPVIALYGSFPLAQWALRKKIKILFLGGVIHDLPIPLVAVSTSMMAKMAMQKLVALGHSRIVLPICDRAPEFLHRLNSVVKQELEIRGHTYIKSYHNPQSPYQTPDVTWRMLESVFAQHPPTALVLLDWRELITAHCYLTKKGWRIPDDVSVVLLHDLIDAAWFQPELARFMYPERRMIRAMIHWVEKGGSGESIKIPPPEFLLGKTIAPPRIDA